MRSRAGSSRAGLRCDVPRSRRPTPATANRVSCPRGGCSRARHRTATPPPPRPPPDCAASTSSHARHCHRSTRSRDATSDPRCHYRHHRINRSQMGCHSYRRRHRRRRLRSARRSQDRRCKGVTWIDGSEISKRPTGHRARRHRCDLSAEPFAAGERRTQSCLPGEYGHGPRVHNDAEPDAGGTDRSKGSATCLAGPRARALSSTRCNTIGPSHSLCMIASSGSVTVPDFGVEATHAVIVVYADKSAEELFR